MFRVRALTVILLALLLCRSAWGLEIRDKRWGFDGKVRPGHFNLLSVLVDNPGARAFDGTLALDDRRGMEKSVGASLVQPIYLAAGTRRWVQFHVCVNQPGGEWHLRWGKGGHEAIDAAQFGPPARVLLIDPESAFATPGGLRAFPDDLFPTTVAATDALDAVVLDHAPRWEAARREAFLDWLHRGGTVHLLRGADGQFPQFPETLAVLNTTDPRTRSGAGIIVRHEASRGEVSEASLNAEGFPAPELKNDGRIFIYNLDTALLQKLAALTRPEIVWWLIYLLTVGYVWVVGPMHYRWSKRLPYARSIALLLAIVAGFGGAFAFAGRRGSNETQQIRALAIAHSLGGGRYDVTQWISAFATRGDFYTLAHASPANLYSTGSEFDSINGAIYAGRDGHFDVDIPLYSTRPFLHRGVLSGAPTDVTVADWKMDADGRLTVLALIPSVAFPKEFTAGWARHRDRFYMLARAGDRWALSDSGGKEATDFFSDRYFADLSLNSYSGPGFFGDDAQKHESRWMEKAGPLLIARALGSVQGLANFVPAPTPPADRLQIYFYGPLPDGFRIKDPRFGSQTGRVLYVQDIFQP